MRGGNGFLSNAAGNKHYGGGRSFPNQGSVGAKGTMGYTKRDAQMDAIKKRLGR